MDKRIRNSLALIILCLVAGSSVLKMHRVVREYQIMDNSERKEIEQAFKRHDAIRNPFYGAKDKFQDGGSSSLSSPIRPFTVESSTRPLGSADHAVSPPPHGGTYQETLSPWR